MGNRGVRSEGSRKVDSNCTSIGSLICHVDQTACIFLRWREIDSTSFLIPFADNHTNNDKTPIKNNIKSKDNRNEKSAKKSR